MENVINAIEKAIKDEEWNIDYHQRKCDESQKKLDNLKAEYEQLKGILPPIEIAA